MVFAARVTVPRARSSLPWRAHAGVPLERVTGLASAIERTASFAGAAMAGALVAFLGAANALVVDAVSFGVCALVFGWATLAMRAEQVDERPAGTTYVEELREGWTFLRRDPVLVAMTGMVAVTNLLDLAFSAVLLPVWIQANGHSVGVLGVYFATWAAASAVDRSWRRGPPSGCRASRCTSGRS